MKNLTVCFVFIKLNNTDEKYQTMCKLRNYKLGWKQLSFSHGSYNRPDHEGREGEEGWCVLQGEG